LALSVSILIQMISAVAAPWLGSRMRDQRIVIAVIMILFLIGMGGCLYAPLDSLWLWIVILGLGQGGAFAMALTLLAVRAADAETASALSAMAQGFGYLLASMGPLAVGLVHDAFGSWAETGILLGLIGLAALAFGLGAGRDRWVGAGC
jgi:CP family cyanate transporter-like MFS transporter